MEIMEHDYHDKAIRRVHYIVFRAIREGRLRRPDRCSECGQAKKRIVAHHENYFMPLDVTWLCCRCHFEIHQPFSPENAGGTSVFHPFNPFPTKPLGDQYFLPII